MAAPGEVVVVCLCGQEPHEPACVLLNEINRKVSRIMAAQDDINAAVAAIQAVTADLASAAANIQAEIATLNAELQAAGSAPVDTSALNTVVTALQGAQSAVDALETPAAG